MASYATIDAHSGFVWWIGEAETPAEACTKSTAETGGDSGVQYEERSRYDAGLSYYVHKVPAGFDVQDGQHPANIEAVEAFPCVGAFVSEGRNEGFGDEA